MEKNATTRFSSKVDNYIKYRPGYPSSLLDFFSKKLEGTSEDTIADIGSGTGLLAQLFLENGNTVYGVEPNEAMRLAGEKLLENYPNFRSIDGTAEKTQLETDSIDFLIAGQAFHWFDVEKSRNEFLRILKPSGVVLLIWNTRDDEKSNLMKDYNDFLLVHSTDYQDIMHRRLDKVTFEGFFKNDNYQKRSFENFQIFDLEGFRGRYLSCSYAFDENHERHQEAMQEIERIFYKNEENGKVKMWYNTEVYVGRLT